MEGFSGFEMCPVSPLFVLLPHALLKEESTSMLGDKDLCFPISTALRYLGIRFWPWTAQEMAWLRVMVTSREFSQARSVWGRQERS